MSFEKTDRIKIFTVLAEQKDLSAVRGDVLNEIETYKRLSSFADVYYNGQLIQLSEKGLGVISQEIQPPDDEYDLYYCRNSPRLYKECKGPLLIMAYPYDREVWEIVDGVVVTTHAWKKFLNDYEQENLFLRGFADPHYPTEIIQPKHIAVFEQSLAPEFLEEDKGKVSELFSAAFGLGFKVGYMGRIDPSSYPYEVAESIRKIQKTDSTVSLTLIGNIKDIDIPEWIQVYDKQPIELMPSVLSAFDCLIYDQDLTGEYLGSAKCLEAMARGVPILSRPYASRVEVFGPDYQLYYRDTDEAQSLIVKLKDNSQFKNEVSTYLHSRRDHFIRSSVEKRLKAEVFSFLNQHGCQESLPIKDNLGVDTL